MKNRMGIGDVERNATDCYERGQLVIPDNVKPTEGEIPVKQYNIATLRSFFKFERAEGRIQVTNKRLIFRAPGRAIGGRTTLQHEYSVDEIAGIEAVKNLRFSLLHLIGGSILLSLGSVVGSFMTMWVIGMAVGLGVILGLLFATAGVISFFMIPKEFKLKLVILGISSSGLTMLLSVIPFLSQFIIIILVFVLVVIGLITLYGQFLFFMRPNLVISIKNKMGSGQGPIDIRRNDKLNRLMGVIALLLYVPVSLVVGMIVPAMTFAFMFDDLLDLSVGIGDLFDYGGGMFDSGGGILSGILLGGVLGMVLLIILVVIIVIIMAVLLSRDNSNGADTGFAEVTPTDEAEGAIREIGAIIKDIQTLGDLGLEKWMKS